MTELELPTWFISFFSALPAAFIGSLLANRKFKKEKLWHEKYKMYQDVLAALEALELWADETYCNCKMIPTQGTAGADTSGWPSFSEARRILAKITRVGSLLLKPEVIDELEVLQNELWKENFRAENELYYPDTQQETEVHAKHAENVGKIVKPVLERIIRLAKDDLN